MAEFKIEGLDKLDAILRELPEKLRRTSLREAQRAGGEILESEIKRRAPYSAESRRSAASKKYGHLRDNIKLAVRTDRNGANARVSTGDAYWAIMVERGTGPEKKGKHPFMRPAIDGRAEDAVDAVISHLRRGLTGG